MQPKELISLMNLMENMKKNTRHSWLSNGRQESVAEHSWRLTMMAWFAAEEFPGIDRDKLIRMCLFHDVGEAFTGDIPAFEKTDANRKAEAEAVANWLQSLPEPDKSELTELFAEMEALETEEAKLYKALDKMEALVQHNEAEIKTWLPKEYQLNLSYGQEEVKFSAYTKELKMEIDTMTKSKIDNSRFQSFMTQLKNKKILPKHLKYPKKAVYLGNSLLCCGHGMFGLAATDIEHDYYALANAEFAKREPLFTAVRANGADWERGIDSAARKAVLEEKFAEMFTDDVDLVVFQLCDNTQPEQMATFAQDAKELIRWAQERCPNAKIVWMAGWYGQEPIFTWIREACEEYGARYIDISPCREVEGARGWVGMIQKFPDGTEGEIQSEGAASHPGNGGMAAIADELVKAVLRE